MCVCVREREREREREIHPYKCMQLIAVGSINRERKRKLREEDLDKHKSGEVKMGEGHNVLASFSYNINYYRKEVLV